MPPVIDPVCGMTVDPATAPASAAYNGSTYYFCNPHCKERFQANPAQYLDHPGGMPMTDVSIAKPQAGGNVEYFCPMDPEVVSDRPGACPKCGMALEPRGAVAGDLPDPEQIDLVRRFWIGLVFVVPLFLLSMAHMALGWHLLPERIHFFIQCALATPVVLYSGRPIFARAWASLLNRSPNMFTLIGIGVAAAYGYSLIALAEPLLISFGLRIDHPLDSYFESAATIVVLVLLGQVLEGRARRATSSAIRELAGLAPKSARLVTADGDEKDVPLELIQTGDLVRIRPGEKVAVDGVVTQGTSPVDEALVSGEPMPVEKAAGNKVVAGSLNGTGTLLVKTERVGKETFLAQMIALVSEAQRSRAPIQRLVDQVARVFVPAVVAAALLTLLGWTIFGGERGWVNGFVNAVAVLIIACPCALGLATPLAIMVGIGEGARSGILVKNAEALEKFHQADVLVVDKTGTLTEGKPHVHEVEGRNAVPPEEVLRLAGSLERGSEHPLAAAIVQAVHEKRLTVAEAHDFQAVAGQGVRGLVNGETLLLGSPRFLDEHGIDVQHIAQRVDMLRKQGRTVLLLAREAQLIGLIGVADTVRATTPEAIRRLEADGLRLVMLTGDSRATADAVAQQLGIHDVRAEVMPAEKLGVIRQLQQEGHIVAMAGDGINDAPALAQADAGIAMGVGADVAMASAGITLARPDLRVLAQARALSRATVRTIRQNLVLAFLYNVLAVPLAAVGWLSPIWAAAAMSLSSLSVVGNSLRLKRGLNETR